MQPEIWLRANADANAPLAFNCAGASEAFEVIEAAAAADGKPAKSATFSMTAYTGVPMRLEGFWNPVVIDLASMKSPKQSVPVLRGHDPERIAGHTTAVESSAQRVKASGILSGKADHTDEVVHTAKGGFPWQASLGATAEKMEYVGKGETVKVNGRNWDGPIFVARGATIREISLVPMGADGNTAASVAAHYQGADMSFEQWLSARGFAHDRLTEQEKTLLKSAFDAEQKIVPLAHPVPTPAPTPVQAQTPSAGETFRLELEAQMTASRAQASAEATRIADVNRVAARYEVTEIEIETAGVKSKVNLAAHAISEGWSAEKTELHALRAARPAVPHFYSPSQPNVSDRVLEAAVFQAGKLNFGDTSLFNPGDRAIYSDQVLQAAHTLYRGRIGLQQLLCHGASLNGGPRLGEVIRDDGDLERVLRAGFRPELRADGASMGSLSNVLANVQNKFLLMGYNAVESGWRRISAIRSNKDFKPTKSVNLLGDFVYSPVGADGELKNATVGDQAFANQLGTYGRIHTITRTMSINDDLGALTMIPTKLGRGWALRINKLFWALFMNPGNDDGASTAFFAATHTITNQSGNSNYSSGAGSALSSGGLSAALKLFRNQVDPNGEPLGLEPAILLVPPTLEITALELMRGVTLVGTGQTTNSKQPNVNVFSGRYEVVVASYLENSNYTGYSTAYWYLMSNPGDLATIEMAFLNGQEQPTVQTAQAEFDTLGISMRGFGDAGVAMQNFRAGVKSIGA